jgi:hypothetical protein
LTEKYERHKKIYTDGFKKEEKVVSAVVEEEQTIRIIITDSLSTMTAVSDEIGTKNSKTQK